MLYLAMYLASLLCNGVLECLNWNLNLELTFWFCKGLIMLLALYIEGSETIHLYWKGIRFDRLD